MSKLRRSEQIALAFLALVIILGLLSIIPMLLLILYLLGSLIAVAAYFFDKQSAESGGWRVSEKTLHTIGMFGGWPGALIAMERFRHKTQKDEFRTVFWTTVAINIILFGYLATPDGAARLGALAGDFLR